MKIKYHTAFATSFSFLITLFYSSTAFAHHPMGGAVPETFTQGLLSGLGHPIIGLDHFAFVVAVGIVAFLIGRNILLPALFAVATVIGCLLNYNGIFMPIAEWVILSSLIFAGGIAALKLNLNRTFITVAIAIFGLFHGWAYGAAIVGGEQTPLIAYLIGFCFIQMLIALSVAFIAKNVTALSKSEMALRLAGAFIVGIASTYMFEMVETAVLTAIVPAS